MTPEQREELKQEALLYNKACEVPWPCPISESAKDRFYDAVTPDAILSLIAQVEALQTAIESHERVLRSSVPDRWKDCTSPVGAVQSYIAELEEQVEALTVPQEPLTYTVDGVVMSPLEYIEYMHRQYAGERLRADQGWERYESANRDRNALRAALASPTIPAIPGTKEDAT